MEGMLQFALPSVCPLSVRSTRLGVLDVYSSFRLPLFISFGSSKRDAESCSSQRCVIFIAGLSDNLFACDHLKLLQTKLSEQNSTLVQPFLRSSHVGCGVSSLRTDVEDLDALIDFLREKYSFIRFSLIGYSTGCQDAVRFLRDGKNASCVASVVLQVCKIGVRSFIYLH